jgi:hypothetical protein
MQTIKTFGFQSASGGGGGSAVTQIIAGTNISISPTTGLGAVTITATDDNTNLGNTDLSANAARTYDVNANDLDIKNGGSSILHIQPTLVEIGQGGGMASLDIYGADSEVPRINIYERDRTNKVQLTMGTLAADREIQFPDASGLLAVYATLGTAGQVLTVNSGADGLEFTTVSGGGGTQRQVLFASFVDAGSSTGLEEKTIPFNTQGEAAFGGSVANADYEGFFFPPAAGSVTSFQYYTTGSGTGVGTLRAYQGFGSSTALFSQDTASFSGNESAKTTVTGGSFVTSDVMIFTIQQTRPLGVFAISIEIQFS